MERRDPWWANIGLVQDGRLTYTSASQLKLAQSCLRKWAYRYLTDLPKPPATRGQLLGDACHREQAEYLSTGVDHRGPLARLHDLPPMTGQAEVEIPRILLGGVPVVGYVDYWLPHVGLIVDHKFLRDLRYALTEETLPQDIQARVYAMAYPQATHWAWLYYRTDRFLRGRAPKADDAHVVIAPITRPVRDDDLITLVGEMQSVVSLRRDELGWLDSITACTDACGQFGGCPYARLCGAKMKNLQEMIAAQVTTCPACQEDLTPEDCSVSATDGRMIHVGCPLSVTPPDAPAPTTPIQSPPPPPPPPAEPQKKRGRKPRSKAPPVDTTAEPQPEAHVPPCGGVCLAADAPTLYIGCLPECPVSSGIELVTEIMTALAKQAGLPDVRLAREGALAFGGWRGAVVAAMRSDPPHGDIYIPGEGELASLVAEAFVGWPTVRGVR